MSRSRDERFHYEKSVTVADEDRLSKESHTKRMYSRDIPQKTLHSATDDYHFSDSEKESIKIIQFIDRKMYIYVCLVYIDEFKMRVLFSYN